ncbi:papain family cysteine protease domain-containing protein [Ditylenchus destructor]|uniref:Papain family cysteine protease domain-containing protein n=1 Tax=Ditylenchus destructor TaxID=166010 RepID=A0AAD4MXW5_9BILA|nr:papain family cysteine protease domain-containing protein [Ditylenchus destructor]
MIQITVTTFLLFAAVYQPSVLAPPNLPQLPSNLPQLHSANSSVPTYLGGDHCNFTPTVSGSKFSAHGYINVIKTKWKNSAEVIQEILKRITGKGVPTVNVTVNIPTPTVNVPPSVPISWDQFKKEYTDRVYSSPAEETLRKKIFEQNLRVIHEKNYLNTINLQSSKLEITSLADLTKEEYERRSTGSLPFHPPAGEHFSNKHSRKIPEVKLKDQLNWALEGYVGKVRDQGNCGSCWAHVASAMLEALHMRATGKFLRFSPQYVMECYDIFDKWKLSKVNTENGCDGGDINTVTNLAIEHGIALDSSYPYTWFSYLFGQTGMCNDDKRKCVVKLNVQKTPGKDAIVPVHPVGDELALKRAVFKYGPIAVIVHSSLDSFKHYGRTVYADVDCKSNKPDHGMLLIGYGTDEVDGDFWLLLNSWGTFWGWNGIMKMSAMWENKPDHMKKGVEKINKGNMCGIASHAYHQTIFQDWETF